ncbi:hypothetical protein PROFUN_01945 [Planoprotostelium fungivorum]|uniref:Uncharacterized protein n=1 Tax=Planoprotostelium fungivorum TaxID=1890364 RepID=A0A2P6NAY8_9EUKA|nr:hypothetical protein PROFUN_01945 [Planoprotostelium fungivorum]
MIGSELKTPNKGDWLRVGSHWDRDKGERSTISKQDSSAASLGPRQRGEIGNQSAGFKRCIDGTKTEGRVTKYSGIKEVLHVSLAIKQMSVTKPRVHCEHLVTVLRYVCAWNSQICHNKQEPCSSMVWKGHRTKIESSKKKVPVSASINKK